MRKGTITTLKRSQLMKYTLLKTGLLATLFWGGQAVTMISCVMATPLIYQHVNPYGRIALDMDQRLALAA